MRCPYVTSKSGVEYCSKNGEPNYLCWILRFGLTKENTIKCIGPYKTEVLFCCDGEYEHSGRQGSRDIYFKGKKSLNSD